MPATRGLGHLALFSYVIVTVGLALAEAGTGVVRKQDGGVDLYAHSAGLQHRNLLHGGVDHTTEVAGARSYTWLKWVAAVVLIVEGLMGIALPALLKLTWRATWLVTLLNTFAGGVFLTFGIMHTLPDAIGYQEEVAFDRFPIAPFLVLISFLGFFFLQKVLAPALKLGHGGPSDAHASGEQVATPRPSKPCCSVAPSAAEAKAVAPTAASLETFDVEAPAEATLQGGCQCGTPAPESSTSLLVEGCGCKGNCGQNCGTQCSTNTCPCMKATAAAAPGAGISNQGQFLASSGGAVAASLAVGRGGGHRGCLSYAMLSPALVMAGVLVHAILEGLAIGLQTSYAGVVIAFVAMASHKWVESIAISARFIKAEAGTWALLAYLVPFSLGPLVGIAIGVSISSSNSWAELVLFSLMSGLFIYIGTCEITAEEFGALDRPGGLEGKPRGARFWLFGALFSGFVVVALLQLVPSS